MTLSQHIFMANPVFHDSSRTGISGKLRQWLPDRKRGRNNPKKSACNSLSACGIILLAIAAGEDIPGGAASEIRLSCIYAYTIKEVRQMSRKCEICGKGQVSGNNVSHSNRHTRRKWNANIQTVRINDNGTVRRANVCTRCIRSGKINRAI